MERLNHIKRQIMVYQFRKIMIINIHILHVQLSATFRNARGHKESIIPIESLLWKQEITF